MNLVYFAGEACLALAIVIALVTLLGANKRTRLPCVFCGAELVGPLFSCKHIVGNGRARN
jgi:hypothetical protein